MEPGLEEKPAIQVTLRGNGARKQLFQIPAFQGPAFYDDVVDFVHGNLF
jgi:hypothetical protein